MKKAFFCLTFLLILLTVCSALTEDDDGYAWQAASDEEKASVCKELPTIVGETEFPWVTIFNKFYSTTNKIALSMKIKEVAPILLIEDYEAWGRASCKFMTEEESSLFWRIYHKNSTYLP